MLLDEFARLGRVDCLSHAAQFVRGYGMRLAFVVQNKAQLRELYGTHAASDIFDNLGAEIVFGTGDLELAQELEKRLGDATVSVITQNRPRWFSVAAASKAARGRASSSQAVVADPGSAADAWSSADYPEAEHAADTGKQNPVVARDGVPEAVLTPPEIPQLTIEIPLDDGSTRSSGGLRAP